MQWRLFVSKKFIPTHFTQIVAFLCPSQIFPNENGNKRSRLILHLPFNWNWIWIYLKAIRHANWIIFPKSKFRPFDTSKSEVKNYEIGWYENEPYSNRSNGLERKSEKQRFHCYFHWISILSLDFIQLNCISPLFCLNSL